MPEKYINAFLLNIALLITLASKYLMGPYNAGPKLALFLRVAEIRAGVKRAGVKRAVFWLKNSKKRR